MVVRCLWWLPCLVLGCGRTSGDFDIAGAHRGPNENGVPRRAASARVTTDGSADRSQRADAEGASGKGPSFEGGIAEATSGAPSSDGRLPEDASDLTAAARDSGRPDARSRDEGSWLALSGGDVARALWVSPDGFGASVPLTGIRFQRAWSPDGSVLAGTLYSDPADPDPTVLYDFRGPSPAGPWEAAPANRRFRWSPTEPWLLVCEDTDFATCHFIDVSTRPYSRRTYRPPEPIPYGEIVWAPDGRRVALVSGSATLPHRAYWIDFRDPDAPIRQIVVAGEPAEAGHVCKWSLNSRWIACDTPGNTTCVVLDTDAAGTTGYVIDAACTGRWDFSWASGGWLVSQGFSGIDAIRWTASGPEPPLRVSDATSWSDWSARGSWLVYTGSCGDAGSGVCGVALGGAAPGPVEHWLGGSFRVPSLSSDGSYVTLTDRDRDQRVLASTAPAAASLMPLGPADWPVLWSPSAEWLVFSDTRPGVRAALLHLPDLRVHTLATLSDDEPANYAFRDDSGAIAGVQTVAGDGGLRFRISVRFLSEGRVSKPLHAVLSERVQHPMWQPATR